MAIPNSKLKPSSITPTSSQGHPAGKSIGRGDLDLAIRSMRVGKRRERPARPLSKMFYDGGNNTTLTRPPSIFVTD
jgi:diaphanous 1